MSKGLFGKIDDDVLCFSTLWSRAGFFTPAYVRIQSNQSKTPPEIIRTHSAIQ